MLISLKEFVEKNKIKIRGIIHVGGHYGQEYSEYKACNAEKVIWIEPCKEAFTKLKEKFGNNKDVKLFNCACSQYTGMAEMFVSPDNEGQSNSLLEPKEHLKNHPEIKFTERELVQVRRLDDLEFDRSEYNVLAMDVQGAEGLVLKGGTETLKGIDIVYTEINRGETYKGNILVGEMDELLTDFIRLETSWINSWGDAIYSRNTKAKPIVKPNTDKHISLDTASVDTNVLATQVESKPYVAPKVEVNPAEEYLKEKGLWDALLKAGLKDEVCIALADYSRDLVDKRTETIREKVITNYRFNIDHLLK
jgi:FkbM family methyltransferase